MTGGLISIVSYGINDLYLTGAPQITFFKVVYRRYTNFAKENVSITINNLNFDQEVQIELPKYGDLIGEMYLQITLPATSFTQEDIGIAHTDPISDTTDNDNYTTVKNFIALNATAYRSAYDNNAAVNVDVVTMITNINSVFALFTAQPDLITQYGALLSNDKSLTGYYWLDPNLSDISKIISQLGAPTNWTNYTKTEILVMAQNAMLNCVKVQDFYYNKLLTYETNYNTELLTTAKFAWVKRLGHSIIDYVSVLIGGEEIDRHYGDWLEVWHDLTASYYQRDIYNKLIGNVSTLTTFDRNTKPSYTMMIPLSFWFNRRVGQSFPIIAMKYQSLYINIKLKKVEDCMYIEKNPDMGVSLSDIWENKGYSLSGALLTNYIYLDTNERKRFAQSAHEYLIERVQRIELNNITDQVNSILLDGFLSPSKEIVWYARKLAYVDNSTGYYINKWDNFGVNSDGTKNPVVSASLTLNGYTRVEQNLGAYYNYLQPYSAHSNTPKDGVNVYSFALYPEEYQPSSSCNFTRISNAILNLVLDKSFFTYRLSDIDPSIVSNSNNDSLNDTSISIIIHIVSYGVLRIVGGMGAIAYQ